MSVTINGTPLKKLTHNGNKVKKWIHNGVKVWSGASVVSYYDSDSSALLTTKEVEADANVLTAYTPSKTNADFLGWSKTKNGTVLSSLTADGNPITLYAVYKYYSIVTYVYPSSRPTAKIYKGSDVLHPSGVPSVSGQTHVGWTYGGSRVTSLTATGSNMTVTAVYVPNTLTVASGKFNGWSGSSAALGISYTLSTWNTAYISGSASLSVNSPGASTSQTAYFTLSFGDYQSASGVFDQGTTNDGQGEGRVDGNLVYNWVPISVSAGRHTLYAYIFPDTGRWEASFVCIQSITLSSPKKWT